MTMHLSPQSYASHVEKIETRVLKVSAKTNWVFVELTISGFVGIGEATLVGSEDKVVDACHLIAGQLNEGQLTSFVPDELATGQQKAPPVLATALSAIEQALFDIESQKQDLPLGYLIGPHKNPSNAVYYANINRGVIERTPEKFAQAASYAVSKGYEYVKFAPFDGIQSSHDDHNNFDVALDHAVACIEAVHETIEGKARFMVDCHSRFSLKTAFTMLDRIKHCAPYWIEEPIPERVENIPESLKFKERANSQGILVAGLEKTYGLNRFNLFIDANIYDVILPDLRWCGGIEEFGRIAEAVTAAGQSISFHNPSGPVLNAISLQVARALPGKVILESQFNESPAFHDIVGDGRANWLQMPNVPELTGPGLGLTLARDVSWDQIKTTLFE